jgi:hypothetical protein
MQVHAMHKHAVRNKTGSPLPDARERHHAGASAVSDAIVQLRDQGFFNSDLVDGLKALPRFIGPVDGRTVRARDYTACIEALRDARAVSAVQKASS